MILVKPKFRVDRSTNLVTEVVHHLPTIPLDGVLFTVILNLIFHR